MLGLVFIYFIGRSYYKLAELYGGHKWGYGILGVAIYYVGTMIGGFVIGIAYAIYLALQGIDIDSIEAGIESSSNWLGILAIPFGLLTCWLGHKYLEKRFNRSLEGNPVHSDSDVLDENLF